METFRYSLDQLNLSSRDEARPQGDETAVRGVESAPTEMELLSRELERIADRHRHSLIERAARIVLGASVIRVFKPGTKPDVLAALSLVPFDELGRLRSEQEFREWYEKQLERVTRALGKKNRRNSRVQPGLKWGHATKILSLFLRDMVSCTRYFTDSQVNKIRPWLYVPLDSIIIKRLRALGMQIPFRRIKDIDTRQKFYSVQEAFGTAAEKVGVPRVWFDDNWASRV